MMISAVKRRFVPTFVWRWFSRRYLLQTQPWRWLTMREIAPNDPMNRKIGFPITVKRPARWKGRTTPPPEIHL